MKFTAEDVRRYQDLCHKYFNEEVGEKAAIEELSDLVSLIALIYHPYTAEVLAELKERIAVWSERERDLKKPVSE
jgi:hypothetical protein